MKFTNKYGLPEPIVRAIKNDPYTRGKSNISVTQLIGPPRLRILAKRHWDELVEDVADRIPSLMGQLGHLVLERAAKDGDVDIQERRFFVDIDGWIVSGQVDLLKAGDAWDVYDFKYTKTWKVMADDHIDWENQLNCYAHMARLNKFSVNSLNIVPILKDWDEKRVGEEDYPPAPSFVVPIKLWDHDAAGQYMLDRVRKHRDAESVDDESLPDCTPAERWVRDESYAVKLIGGSRAKGVFETEDEARAFLDAMPTDRLREVHHIERRGGDSIRFLRWCPVRYICTKNPHREQLANPQSDQQPPVTG